MIKSKSVARAFKAVKRGDFTDLLPYTDWYNFYCLHNFFSPAPIGYESSIGAPHMHAMIMVQTILKYINLIGTFKRPSRIK